LCPGETRVETRLIRDIDFIKNTYFFLDNPTAFAFFRPKEDSLEVFESVEPYEIAADPTLVTFFGRAWVDSTGDGNDIREALLRLELGLPTYPSQNREFRLLELAGDYQFVRDPVEGSVIGIELTRSMDETRVLAVRYVNEYGSTIGNFGVFADTLALELIKPAYAHPKNEFGYTWAYMMRFIYDLGLPYIDYGRFDLQILDDFGGGPTPVGASVPWIRVFGLDQTGSGGVGPPDGQVDLTRGLIDFQRGILTMPILTPFAPSDDLVEMFTDGLFSFDDHPAYTNIRQPRIYTDFLTNPQDQSHFVIKVEAGYPK
jgi:cell surface protein SprA